MDFQTDTQLHVIGDDDISMDVEVTNPGSGLALTGDIGTSGVSTHEAMSYLLPHTSTSTDMHHIESIAEQQGISITTEEPDGSAVLKVDLPIPGDPSDLVQQSSVFISLTSDNVIVKTEEEASHVIQAPVTAVQATPQVGQINLLNYSNNSGRKSLLSKPTNSTVQLTHDGKVNIVTRDKIEVPQVQLQQVMLADGTLAYINLNSNVPETEITHEEIENEDISSQQKGDHLQAVRLDDGSIAYLTASIIPEGSAIDTSNLSLEHTDKSQIESTSADHSSWSDSMDPNQHMLQINSTLPTILSQASTTVQKVPSKSVGNITTPSLFGDKAYKCPYSGCHKVYTTLHHLKVHERTHTGDKPYACEFTGCDKAFATAYGLKSHSRVHTGEKPYKCPMEDCTKAFKTSGDLQKHVRTHTGEKPFKCPFEGCDKRFTTSNIRKVHIRVHTGERPYVCPIDGCGKSFSSATNYKNHVRIHTGERPYVCSVQGCGKRFTEYSSLYKHHIVHTHSKPYVCSHCGKTYRQTSTLAMHKRTAHGDESGTLDLELVIPKQSVVTPIPTNVEDNEGALVINTAENACTENVIISSAASSQQSLINSTITLKPSPSSITTCVSSSNNSPAVAMPIAAVTATTVPKEGLLLPPELQGQRVFVITEPAQLQILQHITQNPQQIQIIKSVAENGATSTTNTFNTVKSSSNNIIISSKDL